MIYHRHSPNTANQTTQVFEQVKEAKDGGKL
jgi:hypothetical protein